MFYLENHLALSGSMASLPRKTSSFPHAIPSTDKGRNYQTLYTKMPKCVKISITSFTT